MVLIDIPIYKMKLTIEQSTNFRKLLDKYGYTNHPDDKTEAICFINKGHIAVLFNGKCSINTIVHESVHVVNYIYEYIGVKLDVVNDEHQAYLTSWVVDEIVKNIKIKK